MKRIPLVILIFCLFFHIGIVASGSESEALYQEIINEITPCNFDDGISRFEYFTAIMKAVGVDKCTAIISANADRMVPVFDDMDINMYGFDVGYIYEAKVAGITVGVNAVSDSKCNFAPQRNITIQEALTAMLRCLTDPSSVSWDMVMEDSVKFGLLQKKELTDYIANAPLQKEQFYTLMYRFLHATRSRYFPIEWPDGSKKIMVTDTASTMRYVDWYLTVKEYCKDCAREEAGSNVWWCANKNCPGER